MKIEITLYYLPYLCGDANPTCLSKQKIIIKNNYILYSSIF